MKKILFLLISVVFSTNLFCQVPEKLSYQAVVRNGNSKLVTNSNIGMQISILRSSPAGTAVYVERQFPSTNENGLVTIEIGNGSIVSGSFGNIDWSSYSYYIKAETDLNGGSNYTISGTSQILSVPYALHAKSAESVTGGINESDPVFSSSPANGISSGNISNWTAAYNWGNHAIAGYLKNFNETDPVFSSSPAKGVSSANINNWNTAFGWGNHATAGYITQGSDALMWKQNNKDIYFNSGNVGIGTMNPTFKLEVAGSMAVNSNNNISWIQSSGTGDEFVFAGIGLADYTTRKEWTFSHRKNGTDVNSLGIEWYDGSSYDRKLTIKPNGNVGIGTMNPTQKLEVAGNVYAYNDLGTSYVSSSGSGNNWDYSGFLLYDKNTGKGWGIKQRQRVQEANNLAIDWFDGSIYKTQFSIKPNGNVGIGTDNPIWKLDVAGSGRFINSETCNYLDISGIGDEWNYAAMSLYDKNSGKFWSVQHQKTNNFGVVWYDGSNYSTPLSIKPNGNVSIGGYNANSKLQVTGGDVYIDNVNSGVIMKSPDGSCWRMTVSNSGQPVFNRIACP